MIVTDYLVKNFPEIMDYAFTANVELDFDRIAEGEIAWNSVISNFYSDFHPRVEETISNKEYNHIERELGTDPSDGKIIIAKFGQYGPYVQKGDGEDKQYASLSKGQLIENITLEDALKLFSLPRTVGQIDGEDVVALKGRFGPYIKYKDKNYSLPKGSDPLKISIEECESLINSSVDNTSSNQIIKEFADADISIINGRYGPYIKHGGSNYKLPKGTDANTLDEQACKQIIADSKPSAPKFKKRYKK